MRTNREQALDADLGLQGQGKQVPAELFRSYSNRKAKGVIGIKLAKGDRLAAFHVVSSSLSLGAGLWSAGLCQFQAG